LALEAFELFGAENHEGEQATNLNPDEADEHGSA
jgi:hypothetical protein